MNGDMLMAETIPVVKKMFPFRLGTTSYIVPDAVLPNIRFLGPHVDEIELLLFESTGEFALPSPAEIGEMRRLASELDLVYNVHLPSDVFLGDREPGVREQSVRTIRRFIERTSLLAPTAFILHCESADSDGERNTDMEAWQDRVSGSLDSLVRSGIEPHRIALENLDYPPEQVLPLAERFGMRLCLDIGHLLHRGHKLDGIRLYLEKSSMVHLHGVKNGKDHAGAQWIPEETWALIRGALFQSFRGGVSLEVFSLKELVPSLLRFAA